MPTRAGRTAGPPRLPRGGAPRITAAGAIPSDPSMFPDEIEYEPSAQRLKIGGGFVQNVSREIWDYEVSGKPVLPQWFSYRKANRDRPVIGDRREPSALSDIQPDHWLAEYTTELLNLVHVLGRLIELEPEQAKLLKRICSGKTISADELPDEDTVRPPIAESRHSGHGGGIGQKNFLDHM